MLNNRDLADRAEQRRKDVKNRFMEHGKEIDMAAAEAIDRHREEVEKKLEEEKAQASVDESARFKKFKHYMHEQD